MSTSANIILALQITLLALETGSITVYDYIQNKLYQVMLKTKKPFVVVVMPAYNAELTLEKTFNEIPFEYIDDVILVDDMSSDRTTNVAEQLGIKFIIKHSVNSGYGANLKTCYDLALNINADLIITLHPDYQYPPQCIVPMIELMKNNQYQVVFGSRILGKGALSRGMPIYKYIFNRILTLFQNLLLRQKLSEYHTGFRCISADVLRKIEYKYNSNDFVFDNELAAQIIYLGVEIGEISCPARYFPEASSINFFRSIKYGLGVLDVSLKFFLSKMGIVKCNLFQRCNK